MIAVAELLEDPFSGWWEAAKTFLTHVQMETLMALSPDYESSERLAEVIQLTKERIGELLKLEPCLPKALERFSDEQSVRILTMHKSKGLEFDSVIILGVENETFWGSIEEERCTFFVGVSRAKHRLVMTVCTRRETPPSNPRRWRVERSVHEEFYGYARPFLTNA